MAWFSDYNRDFNRPAGYDRSRNRGDLSGWRSSGYGYDRGFAGGSDGRRGYGRDYLGRQFGYDSDYDRHFRRRPEESPFYGREADQGVQRWAQRYGYDMQYEIEPRGGGQGGHSQGGYGGSRGRGWGEGPGRGTGGFGRSRQGSQNLGRRGPEYNW